MYFMNMGSLARGGDMVDTGGMVWCDNGGVMSDEPSEREREWFNEANFNERCLTDFDSRYANYDLNTNTEHVL